MQKKGFIAVLSAIVLMIVASVSLVLAVGHNASADSEEIGVLDKAEYFHFADDEHTIIDGLSEEGDIYASQYQQLRAVIPDGVKQITGRYCGFDKLGDIYASVFTYYDVRYVEMDTDEVEDGYFDNFRGWSIIEVTLPETLETIGDYAFNSCGNLTTITIPENVTTIGNHAFESCFGLETITIPTNVTTIGDYAFAGCGNLTTITIPENVTIVGEYVFDDCDNLQSIVLENDDLFDHPNLQPYADKIARIGVLDKAEYYHFANDEHTIIDGLSYLGCEYADQFNYLEAVIPDGVKEIYGIIDPEYYDPDSVFSYYATKTLQVEEDPPFNNSYFRGYDVITVTLPETLETIGDYAFTNCYNLTTITIPEKVTTIGNCAFESCLGLETITIPANVTTIGEYVFDDCYYLQSIVLENDDLFDHPNLQPYADKLQVLGVAVLDKSEYFVIDENGVLCGLSAAGHWYANRYNELHVIIPDDVVEIRAFETDYRGAISINSVFTNMDYEDSIYFTDVFDYGRKVTSIVLPDTLRAIDGGAFTSCQISNIRIPQSVEVINPYIVGDRFGTETFYVFDYCKNLTTIYCEAAEKPDGWSDDWNTLKVYDEEQGEYVDAPIHTVWDCNKTITFDVNGGNQTIDNQTVCVDSLVTKPTDPTKDSYEFKGWFDNNGNEYDFATPVTADMTLTAQWEAIPEQPEQPEPSNPEQPTTPENPEQPTTPDTDTETVTVGSKNGFNLGAAIGGGLVAGLGTISAIAATIIARRRHK